MEGGDVAGGEVAGGSVAGGSVAGGEVAGGDVGEGAPWDDDAAAVVVIGLPDGLSTHHKPNASFTPCPFA